MTWISYLRSLTKDRPLAVAGLLLIGLFFSYQPVITIGSLKGMNLELSLAQLAAVTFIIAQLRTIYAKRHQLVRIVGLQLLFVYSLVCSLSILWAEEKARALVIAAYTWFLFMVVVSIVSFVSRQRLRRLEPLLWGLVIIMALVGWWQVFAEALGVPPDFTLLRPEYRSQVFGFARPQGFALEPEFFASLFIAPIVYGVWRELSRTSTRLSRIAWLLGVSVVVATISRGALLALGAALLVLLFARAPLGRKVMVYGAGLMVTAGAVLLLSVAGAINTRDTISGEASFVRTVNQLTLGMARLSTQPADSSGDTPVAATEPEEPEGYVASSTTSRLSMSRAALAIWVSSPSNLLAGVGVSNFAATLRAEQPQYPESSIVNNQYLEALVETGVIGFVLLVSALALPLIVCLRRRWLLGAAVLIGFYVQWCFFSGSANVVHIWVILGVIYALLSQGVVKITLKKA